MQNFDSPFTTSMCNYYEESPNNIKYNFIISKPNQINLNPDFYEMDSSLKEDNLQNINLKLNKTPIKYTKSHFISNNNSQSRSIKNYNSSSISLQYSDSEIKSEVSKSINKIKEEKKNKKNFVIEKNENLEIITSKHDYQVSHCICNNNLFTSFSIEINPKHINKKITNNVYGIETVKKETNEPKNILEVKSERKNNDIKINNGFRLIPLTTIEEKYSTPSNNNKFKTMENSSQNKFLKNYGKTANSNEKVYNFMQNNFMKNTNNNQKRNSNEKESNNKSNSKGKKKLIVKNKNNNQKPENKIKPNSNNDINDIIQRHFQQKSITKFISNTKSKKTSSHDKNNNSKNIISYTFYQNQFPNKKLNSQITNNLFKELKEKKNKTQMYSSSRKNSNYNLNNIDNSNSKNKQDLNNNKNSRQKIKTYINLSSILNKFNSKSVKKTNNKSLGYFTQIISNNQILNDNNTKETKNCIQTNIYNQPLMNQINKNNQVMIQEKKNIKELNNNSNNNSYISKIIHTQETVNSSKDNNNYINTTSNLSSNKKSPQVINDFSFYKRKINYRAHFVSLVNPRDNNKSCNNYTNNNINRNNSNNINNVCQSELKIYPNRKQPIASIKLMKLEGDIDSNISRDSDL